ncbi:MAG TPA: PAS domain S-box protein [Pyrinomonadaceae bacterium]|jgi:PAS domain S-box-containing protein|nr:PAS domain S-box protein [Pyrinomonadaceae bacterium]
MKTKKQSSPNNAHHQRRFSTAQLPPAKTTDEDQLLSFVNSLPGYSWMKDLNGRYVYGNAALQTLSAYRAGYIGMTDADIWPAEIAKVYRANDLKVIAERKPLETIEPYLIDGQDHFMHVSKFPIFDHRGAVIMVGGSSVDITERKKAEAALRTAEQHYRDIFENAGEGIFQTTPEGRYIAANPALARMHGFDSPEELMSQRQSPDAYVDPARREVFKRMLETKGVVRAFEFDLARRDGTNICVSVNARAVRDEDGAIRYYEGTVQDITEPKASQEALRESEERYRDLVENSHELICTHGLDGLILTANNAAAIALGYDLDLFVGKKNIRDILAPEVSRQFDEYMERLRRHGSTGGLMLVQTSSGERRVWEYYNSLRTEGVDTPIVRGMARDVTEQRRAETALRESEERYRELFENSRDAIYVHDLRGFYTSVNRAAEQLSGFPRDEIIGRHYSNFVSPQHLKDARENFCRKLDVPIETTYEAEALRKNGEHVPVEVSSRLIYKDGNVVGVQGTVRDVSERKRSQRALQTYARRVIEAQEIERQNVARELHDEIGQILTAVLLNLQSVERTCTFRTCVPDVKESIQVVEDALKRVRELSLELRPSLLDDLGLVAAARWYAARYTARSGIVTEIIGDNDIGRISRELETACFRIIQEALTNTARHSRATRADIQIKRTNVHLYLTVRDNGIGFDAEALLNGQPSALALGLHGMSERASAVSGHLDIESAPGRGTQVRVMVPLGT